MSSLIFELLISDKIIQPLFN